MRELSLQKAQEAYGDDPAGKAFAVQMKTRARMPRSHINDRRPGQPSTADMESSEQAG